MAPTAIQLLLGARVRFPVALVVVVLVSGTIGWGLSQNGPARTLTVPIVHHRAAGLPTGWSYVARAPAGELSVYAQPAHGSRPALTLTNRIVAGEPLTLLVRKVRGPWIQIYLPVRPDGATGWVHARKVKLLTTAYSLAVELRSHRLVLSISGRVFRVFSIGVGKSVTPTPTGTYFITELLKQPNPAGLYGPYAFGLSAYSGVLSHFGRGGNGQIGIHGTNQPWLVGTDVSHGCIRLQNSDIIWLTKRLPLGTPVTIGRV